MTRRIYAYLAFACIGITVPGIARAQEAAQTGGSSMPQLDPTYYASQIFWLTLCGGLLYIVMAKLALPGIAAMIDRREHSVQHDLEQSYRFKHEAEDLQTAYTHALRDADEKAATLVDRTIIEMKGRNDAAVEEAMARLNDQVVDVQQNMVKQKQDILDNLDMIAGRLSVDVAGKLGRRV